MSEDVSQLLTYIKERECNLARCSDKLRQTIERFEMIFSWKGNCRNCGYPLSAHGKEKENFSDKTRAKICDNPQPAIEVSLDIIDDVPFWQDSQEKLYLAIENHHLKAAGIASEDDISDPETRFYEWLSKLSCEKLKALIRSRRLIPFLQKVAEMLKEAEQEYSEVAEIAEKIANAIS